MSCLRIDGGDPDFVFAALDLSNPEAEEAVYDYMQDRNSDAGAPSGCLGFSIAFSMLCLSDFHSKWLNFLA